AVAGFLVAAVVIPSVYMAIGLVVVELSEHWGLVKLISNFLPDIVVLALAIMLGDAVRSRRALAPEAAGRLRVGDEGRRAGGGWRRSGCGSPGTCTTRWRTAWPRSRSRRARHCTCWVTGTNGSAGRSPRSGRPARTRSGICAPRSASCARAPRTAPSG